jgi:predicted kinase
VLVIVGGLPATGKTTICRQTARANGAVHLRIDTIEQAVVDSGLTQHPVGCVGYVVGYALATDHLRQGMTVLADSVNPLAITRDAWRAVAVTAGVPALEVEFICSDAAEHRRRAESRRTDIAGLIPPSWSQIVARRYEPWSRERLVLDTTTLTVADAVAELRRAMAAAAAPPPPQLHPPTAQPVRRVAARGDADSG